jgi:hypothetical protein
MLCEALTYVKLNFFIPELPFIFALCLLIYCT